MPKKSGRTFTITLLFAAAALVMFVAGEALIMTRTDSGRLTAARWFHVGDDASVTALLSRHIRQGLDEAGIARDSVRESVSSLRPRVRWRIGLKPRTSTLQVNYAVTRALEAAGATVISGKEAP